MKLEIKKIGSLHKRWLANITLVILAVGLVCVAAITASYAFYCYNNMSSDLHNRAKSATEFFKDYREQDYESFYESCSAYAQTVEEGARLEPPPFCVQVRIAYAGKNSRVSRSARAG